MFLSGGKKQGVVRNVLSALWSILVPGLVLGYGAYHTQKLFSLQLTDKYTIASKVGKWLSVGEKRLT
jgi:hypothetical protein